MRAAVMRIIRARKIGCRWRVFGLARFRNNVGRWACLS